MATRRTVEFDAGYKRGYNGKPMDWERAARSEAYYIGYDAGCCDRPTLEELQPIDIEHEASDGCLS